MRLIVILFLGVCLLPSCKKCYQCNDKCYVFYFPRGGTDTICSTEFMNKPSFNVMFQTNLSYAESYVEIAPTKEFEKCNPSKDLLNAWDYEGYYCINKK